MKIERVDQNFKPVTITLETQEEFNVFYDIANYSRLVASELRKRNAIVLRTSAHSDVLYALWEKLR